MPRGSNYVPIRCLGRGAFGEATLYRKTEDNSLVVWKEVDLGRMDLKEQQAALSEVDILSSLPPHPNIIQYFTHFQSYPPEAPMLLIEMEYASGGNLQQYIGRATYPLEQEAVEWLFYQLMSGVRHIHNVHVLHRDIKSMNIFLNRTDALLKLGDFGISKRLDQSQHMAQSVVGTPYYMSPELMQGLQYDEKSDIWACGCVLFELLTLKKSFDATNALRLAHDVVHGNLQGTVDRNVFSGDICDLVDKMLSPDPKDRPSAAEVLSNSCFQDRSKMYELRLARAAARISTTPSIPRPNSAGNLNSSTNDSVDCGDSVSGSDSFYAHSSSSLSFVGSGASFTTNPTIASQGSEVFTWGGGRLTPVKLEEFSLKQASSAISVAVGPNVMAAISLERDLLTWTASGCSPEYNTGQLGHGALKSQRRPKVVEALDCQVQQVACGSEFTLILTAEGSLLFCGMVDLDTMDEEEDPDESEIDDVNEPAFDITAPNLTPTLLPTPINTKVQYIACGSNHCIVVTQTAYGGQLYSWGCGEFGRLGLGHENDVAKPTKVTTPEGECFTFVACGTDYTMALTSNGRLYSSGSNEFNKIGQNIIGPSGVKASRKMGFDSPCIYSMTLSKTLSALRFTFACCGYSHSALIDVNGRIVVLGDNSHGQLGNGDLSVKEAKGYHIVQGVFVGKKCHKLSCGDYFTVAATTDNEVYAWGLASEGRLGFDTSEVSSLANYSDKSERANAKQQIVSRPKPVFGALHSVTGLASSGWYTILIAERVESTKTINADPVTLISCADEWNGRIEDNFYDYSDSQNTFDISAFGFKPGDDSRERGQPQSSLGESSFAPDWLLKEMESAEFIAVDEKERIQSHEKGVGDFSQLSRKSTKGAILQVTLDLTKEIERLRTENLRLNDIIREQQIRIDQMEKEEQTNN
ncbi:serine/threonine-protein kinase Nek9-like isoform X2 [Convolutriloba macropyga]|uniref:serine/threonine-protein kinase Nek9-like isoform X2 n=1 Tax=Convolutriloba macropyga TaxID=536237 RepID=UPI003F5269A3